MRIALFYFALFASVGITLPYLPPYFRSLGFSGKEIAAASSLQPLLMIVVPPIWGYLADRLHRPTLLLRIACTGAAIAFTPMLFADRFWQVAAVLAVYASFSTTISSLADSVAVVEARRLETDFARLRLWGSVAFVVSSSAFGAWMSRGGEPRDAVLAGLVLMFGYALASRLIRPAPTAHVAVPSVREAALLLRQPTVLFFFFAGLVHWAAMSPYNLFFAVHLRDVGANPSWIGLGLAVAVIAEVAVMWRFRDLVQRIPLTPLLALSFLSGVARYFVTGLSSSGAVIAAAQLLHGLTFAAFYIGSIAMLERLVPEHLRATGRAIFASVVFGLGGVAGNALAGSLYDVGGARLAYFAAAALEVVPVLLLLAGIRHRMRAA